MIEFVPASPLHVGPVTTRLSTAAKFGAVRPRAALRFYMALSVECWTALADGIPVAMWGVRASPLATSGTVWFYVGEPARRYRFSMLRGAAAFLAHVLQTFHEIEGLVAVGDERSMRFAMALGFADVGSDGDARRMRIAR